MRGRASRPRLLQMPVGYAVPMLELNNWPSDRGFYAVCERLHASARTSGVNPARSTAGKCGVRGTRSHWGSGRLAPFDRVTSR